MKSTEISTNRICPQITGSNIDYIMARFTPKLSSIVEAKAILHLLVIINRCFAELDKVPTGMTVTERTRYLENMARMILNDLNLYFRNITIKEVDEAVKRGIRGYYGEYRAFNVIAVHTFVEKYLASEERLTAIEQQKRYLQEKDVPQELPMENRWLIIRNGLLRCYDIYCKSGRLTDFGNVNYELLTRAGEIVLTDDEKKEIYERAKVLISCEYQQQANANMWARMQMLHRHDDSQEAVRRSKELALKAYYDTKPNLMKIMDKLRETYMNNPI